MTVLDEIAIVSSARLIGASVLVEAATTRAEFITTAKAERYIGRWATCGGAPGSVRAVVSTLMLSDGAKVFVNSHRVS